MDINVTKENFTTTVKLDGNFNYSNHKQIKDLIEPIIEDFNCKTLCFDFDGVSYIDSSALGMLLLIREKVFNESKELKLINVKGIVLDVFEIANFKKLFSIN